MTQHLMVQLSIRSLFTRPSLLAAVLLPVIMLMPGCTTWYAEWADRDAYGTITEGQQAALGKQHPFDIAYNPVDFEGYLKEAEDETGSHVQVLTLEDALKVAFKNSRSFQTRKENLYRSALYLATISRGWESILPGGGVSGIAEKSRTDNQEGSDNTSKYISGDGNFSLTRRLVGGGLLTLGASVNFLKDFLGLSSNTQVGSFVEGTFTQPLLQGAWRGLAYEPQHRRERDFLIDVYEFDRFRQTFSVDIMDQYYGVLTLKDSLENSRTNVNRLRTAYLVTKALVDGDQLTSAQQDQAEQNLLSAQISLERTQLAYSNSLDSFKISLGLPISEELVLDYPGALQRLARKWLDEKEKKADPLPFTESAATVMSLKTDTNLLKARKLVRDAEKDVVIAADLFLPQFDLKLNASVPGTDNDDKHDEPWRLQTHRLAKSAQLSFNYELDQTGNRDGYRTAMIAYDQAKRNLDENRDIAALNVRNSFRSLEQSKQSYMLQERSVIIAERRTKLVAIQRKQGQASTRDVLEAEDALKTSLNGLTSSLVDYTITRLKFMASLGMIDVTHDGILSIRETPFGYDRLQERYPYLQSGSQTKENQDKEKADEK